MRLAKANPRSGGPVRAFDDMMSAVRPLDYETPEPRKPQSGALWGAFLGAYLPGLLLLDIVDDILHRRISGHPNDGNIMIVSLVFSPAFAGIAAVIKNIWKRYESVGFAVAFAILAPLVVYLLMFLWSI
jgi:hypothetical protein